MTDLTAVAVAWAAERGISRTTLEALGVGSGTPGRQASAIITAAGELTDFILGTNDAEILRAAGELAEKVRGDG